jgi:hypothetical protein
MVRKNLERGDVGIEYRIQTRLFLEHIAGADVVGRCLRDRMGSTLPAPKPEV